MENTFSDKDSQKPKSHYSSRDSYGGLGQQVNFEFDEEEYGLAKKSIDI